MVKDSFSFKLWYSSCIYYLDGTNSKIMCLPIFRNITEIVNMVLGDAVTKLQRFVWLLNHVSRVITWSLFNLSAPNLANDQSQHNLLYGRVSLSISLNLKLARVPYTTSKWPIVKCRQRHGLLLKRRNYQFWNLD